MKKILIMLFMVFIMCTGCGVKELPKPEVTDGVRGEQFGIDKNINEATIDEYLNREDTIYMDMM